MKIGKSNARIYFERDTGVRFRDVAGIEQAQAELQELVNYLDHPQRYGRLGASIPKGVLLVGPPGTGKTLMARAVAGEAGVPFFSITGSEFVEMFVGVGAARVRDLFQQARQQAPAIIFVDELDAFARARGTSGPSAGGDDERENTLNQLLSELDGFDPAEALVLLAATNRPELLDAALLRAGRFDRRILLDRPDRKGRAKILMLNLEKITPAADVEADELARLTTGFTGADLTNLVNEAALLATRRDADAVYRDDFLRAMERIIAGLEKKNRLMNEHERTIVAHHELGHALIAMALGSSPVHKVSIIPRGIGALGWTMQRPTEDRYLMTRPELENKIAVMLGGRAAEELSFGEISTGAADDIERATQTARAMITQYGMDSELGYVAYDKVPGAPDEGVDDPEGRPIAEATQEAIDRATRDLVHALYERAYRILENNAEVLRRTAAELLEQETLQADDLRELTRDLRCEEPKDRPRV
jgi:cell division protease FtsH